MGQNVHKISLSDTGETVDASAYGVPNVPILLDDVKCTGSESNIFSCPQLPLNTTHNCVHKEDVAIKCVGEVLISTQLNRGYLKSGMYQSAMFFI